MIDRSPGPRALFASIGLAPMLAVIFALGFAPSPQEDKSTTKAQHGKLDNGLRLILRPVQGSKEVSLVILFDIGGDHDPKGRSGMAHLLEHLYVTAAAGETPARTAVEYFKKYAARANAQTGDDYTVVAAQFPKADLEAELADAAARMGDLKIEPADLLRERPRLLEEVANMFGRMPLLGVQNLAGEKIRPSPHGGRKGGLPEHVETITVEALRDRWTKLYKPRNATLIVTGAIEPEAVARLVKDAFGEIPEGEPVPEAPEIETPERPNGADDGPEVVEVEPLQPGQAAVACIALRGPRPGEPHYPAFVVAAARLMIAAFGMGAGGPDGLVVGWTPMDDPERFRVAGPLKDGESAKDAVARLDAWMRKTLKPDLAAADRMAIQNNLGFFFWPESYPDPFLQNLYGLGFGLGRHRQLGHEPGRLDEALGALEPVDFRRVVETMFLGARRSVVVVKPTR